MDNVGLLLLVVAIWFAIWIVWDALSVEETHQEDFNKRSKTGGLRGTDGEHE